MSSKRKCLTGFTGSGLLSGRRQKGVTATKGGEDVEGGDQGDTKETMPKTSSKSLEVALISLNLKKDQTPFLWTPTSKVWCSKFIACHCISEVQRPLALACERKQGVIFARLRKLQEEKS